MQPIQPQFRRKGDENYEKKWNINAAFEYSGEVWNWIVFQRKL